MVMAALSPNSILASPGHVNPQVRADLQTSEPQTAQNAEKTAATVQTDTVTISAQALKMAGDRNTVAKEADNRGDRRKARKKNSAPRNSNQRNALRSYTAAQSNQ